MTSTGLWSRLSMDLGYCVDYWLLAHIIPTAWWTGWMVGEGKAAGLAHRYCSIGGTRHKGCDRSDGFILLVYKYDMYLFHISDGLLYCFIIANQTTFFAAALVYYGQMLPPDVCGPLRE